MMMLMWPLIETINTNFRICGIVIVNMDQNVLTLDRKGRRNAGVFLTPSSIPSATVPCLGFLTPLPINMAVGPCLNFISF